MIRATVSPHRQTPLMLVIDNYDSFTHNLVQMFLVYELNIVVKRSDKITLFEAETLDPDGILISPGPKDPAHAGVSRDIIRHFHTRKPILGVCLGMQCLNEVFGGITRRAPVPVHGKTDQILHSGRGIFQGMPVPFAAARYHSLITVPGHPDLETTAWNREGIAMGLQLKGLPVFGVQFHPESFMTEKGEKIIHNFLTTAAGFSGFQGVQETTTYA